ncbi:PREDICTED: protein FAM207A [Tinamus guttatus]|uniref:protein FAM207A n=1 Tax=Tinamus guttatus TaxID=94827 RepID=UPI00052E8584|nr:PREDICTED: protein FAM207A [Tinamus guttatus]
MQETEAKLLDFGGTTASMFKLKLGSEQGKNIKGITSYPMDLSSAFLNGAPEIEGVKLAKQKQKAEVKRKATPVVGDMQPLMEALPELFDLTTGGRDKKTPKRYVTTKAEPTDFCVMKQAQKHRLLQEEMARFHEVITNPKYKANPLMAISEHLSKRLRQEEEEGKPF